jgi:hypothetical protein
MVAIHLNANYIFVEPMRSRSKEAMIWAYEKIINRMRLAGLGLKKHILDNEASEAFKQGLQTMHPRTTDAIQTAPPG